MQNDHTVLEFYKRKVFDWVYLGGRKNMGWVRRLETPDRHRVLLKIAQALMREGTRTE